MAPTTRSRSTRRSPSSSRSCPPSSTSTTSTWSSATSSRTTSSRSGDAVKLIDLGGVRRLDDLDSAIYGTTGYQAPEVPHVGPSVASDIYTIGRTLTVLAMEFRGYQSTYVSLAAAGRRDTAVPEARLALPAAAQGVRPRPGRPVRLRGRAARAAPRGAARGGGPRARGRGRALDVLPALRRRRRSRTTRCDWQDLPTLRVDDSDPQMPWLRTVSIDDPVQRLAALESAPAKSAPRCCSPRREPRSRPGSYERVDEAVQALLADDPWEWRAVWMSGLVALARDRTAEAQSAFNAVYGQVPGELAPKLALAVRLRDRRRGRRCRVALRRLRAHATPTTSRQQPSAWPGSAPAAGTSRVRSAPSTWCRRPAAPSPQARRRRAGLLAESGGGLPSLAAALESIDNLTIDPVDRSRFRVDVLQLGARAGGVARCRHDGPHRRPSGGRARPARRARGGIPGPGRLRRQPGGAGRTSSTRPTRSADGRCDDGAGRGRGRGAGRAIRGGPVPGRWRPPVLPVLLGTRRRGRAVLRGLWRRPRPIARVGRGRGACGRGGGAADERWRLRTSRWRLRTSRRQLRTSLRQRGPAVSAAVTSRTTATARSAGPGRPARATTSPSSPRHGWPPCATAASATRATRTRSPCTPGPSPGSHAVLVVCDGVSSSTDSDVASLAAARAARDVLAVSDPQGHGHGRHPRRGDRQGTRVCRRRGQRGRGRPHLGGPGNPASCTFVAAVVDESLLVVGWVGDSRAYWLPDVGEPQLLTVDDSFAAEQIADGVPRAEAESGPQAHAITRWLGIDAPDHTPRTASLDLAGPGWVLVCSDGLWNYCSEPRDLAALVAGDEPRLGLRPAAAGRGPGRLGQRPGGTGQHHGGPRPGRLTGPDRHCTAHRRTAHRRSGLEPAAYREEVPPDGNVLS